MDAHRAHVHRCQRTPIAIAIASIFLGGVWTGSNPWTGSPCVQFVALSGPVQGGIATPILNRFMHLNRTKTDTMLKDGVWTGVNFETCTYTCMNHPRHPLGRAACSWTGSKTVHRFKTPSEPVHRESFLVWYCTVLVYKYIPEKIHQYSVSVFSICLQYLCKLTKIYTALVPKMTSPC